MRLHWRRLVPLGGALLLLASLYLPWRRASCTGDCGGGGVLGLLHDFSGGTPSIEGWASGVGDATALAALVVAATALVRRKPIDSVVRGLLALLAAYFGVGLLVQTGSIATYHRFGEPSFRFHVAYGAYLGLSGAFVLLLAGAFELLSVVRHRSVEALVAVVPAVGLLVALLLPWVSTETPRGRFSLLGLPEPAAPAVALLALCVPVAWGNPRLTRHRLVIAAAVALFTGAVFSSQPIPVGHAYGAWLGLGCGFALVLLALAQRPMWWDLARLPWLMLAIGLAAILFVSTLFLPWQRSCAPGQCLSYEGWAFVTGSGAAFLALGLAAAVVARRNRSLPELATGVALLVATLGFELVPIPNLGVHFAYGSWLGFSAAGLLAGLSLLLVRPIMPSWDRALPRLLPTAACLAYLVILVLPWWQVLPDDVQSALGNLRPSWLTMGAVLGGIYLLGFWLRLTLTSRASSEWLAALPLLLVALVALELIRYREDGITWGSGALVGLGLFLALAGVLEQRIGLENVAVPEVLRIDRL